MTREHEASRGGSGEEDILAFAWKALGLLLGLVAFCLVSVPGVLQTQDPAVSVGQGFGAFLLLWGLNRLLAYALGLRAPSRGAWRGAPLGRDEGGSAR